MRRTPIKTGTQLIFPVLRIGDFFCVFVRYQIVINCVFSYLNWVITQIRSLIKVLGVMSFQVVSLSKIQIDFKSEKSVCCLSGRHFLAILGRRPRAFLIGKISDVNLEVGKFLEYSKLIIFSKLT